MANKLALTVADVTGGNYVPHTGLTSSDFTFVLASDGVTPVPFSGFAEIGNGNYTFDTFTVSSGSVPYLEVKVKIGGTIQSGFGIITIYANSDEPASQSFNSAHFLDLVSNQTAGGNKTFSGQLINSGSQALLQATHTYITHPLIDGSSSEYLTDVPAFGNSLVWRNWVQNHFLPLNSNRILVDDSAPTEIAGKIHTSISSAVSWIHANVTLSSSNRWQIFVAPSKQGQYIENFMWYDFIDIIGLGWVKVTNTPTYSLFIRAGAMNDYNCRAVNLQFEQTDQNLEFYLMLMQNCSAVMVEDNYSPILSLKQSQYINCNFSGIGSYSVTSGKGNHVFNCTGGYNVAWDASDKTYNWAYITGDYIHQ